MTRDEKIIRNKVGVLELAKQLGSVSQACRIMATDTVLPVKPLDLRRLFIGKDASLLASVKDEAHPVARWPSAILDLRGARRQCRRPIGTAG